MNPFILGIALLAGLGLGLWLRRQAPGGGGANVMAIPAGSKTTVTPPCGQPFLIGPFTGRRLPGGAGARANAQVVIRVISACGSNEAEIEIEQTRPNTYETLRERVRAGRDDKPQVGSCYVVPVPDGRRIRLTCPGGDGRCEFEVTDVTNLPLLDFDITPNALTPTCGARAIPRLVNLSRDVISVTVTFNSLCTDAHGNPQAGLIHKIPIRPTGAPMTPVRDPNPLPAPADIRVAPVTPGPTRWHSALEGGYALEASCSGTHGGCSIIVRAQR